TRETAPPFQRQDDFGKPRQTVNRSRSRHSGKGTQQNAFPAVPRQDGRDPLHDPGLRFLVGNGQGYDLFRPPERSRYERFIDPQVNQAQVAQLDGEGPYSAPRPVAAGQKPLQGKIQRLGDPEQLLQTRNPCSALEVRELLSLELAPLGQRRLRQPLVTARN